VSDRAHCFSARSGIKHSIEHLKDSIPSL
jgi:hypothetical protein